MPQVVNTNVLSLNAQRNLNNSASGLQVSLQRLSSGLRINTAKDDAAGLAISERFIAQIRGLNQGARNAADAISLAQTAEGAYGEMTTNVQRIRELSVQATNATNSSSDRASLDTEVQQLIAEVTRITTTKFNGTSILSAANTFKFQVGANSGDSIDVTTVDITADASYTAFIAGDVSTSAQAVAMMGLADNFLTAINTQRATMGSVMNRFESVIRNVQNTAENLSAANSRIRDADFAAETAALTRAQILQQAGVAMLSQANAAPQSVLSLLQ